MQGRAGNEERTQRYEVTQGATNSEDWNGFREAEKVPKNFLGKRRSSGEKERGFTPGKPNRLYGKEDEQWSEGGLTGDDRYGTCEDVGGND